MTVAPAPSGAGPFGADAGGVAAPLAVVVVDDSAVQRRFARAALEADPAVKVVGEARNGRDAVALVERLRPDVVLMDLHLPVMNGIEAIERIMAARPTPILVYSAFVDGADGGNAVAALAAGAVDVIAKPGGNDGGDLDSFAEALRRRVRVAGRVMVITHPRGRLNGAPVATVSTHRLGGQRQRPGGPAPTPGGPQGSVGPAPRPVRLVVVGASTGGPQALAKLLAALPADLGCAVLCVQHMADGFVEGLAGWLDNLCPLPVAVGCTGRRLQPGTVTVAPSGSNLVVHPQLRVTTHRPPPKQYHVPNIDATLSSVADSVGRDAVGILLTGMGRDGAAGLKRMRERGAFTIAQDERTSVVYGMPAAAMELDAVDLQLALPDIAAAVLALTAGTWCA